VGGRRCGSARCGRRPPSLLASPPQVVDALACSRTPPHAAHYTAFYSSELGGVTTEPGLFVVHADDHAFHRGHAVFDTCEIIEGHTYALDAHLARFFASADAARLALPFSRAQVRRVILETAAAGRAMDGHVRYWLGAGRGGFGLSMRECGAPSLFVVAYRRAAAPPPVDPAGVAVKSATCVPPPDALLATTKTTNYLRHALALAEAEDAGCAHAVFVDADGNVTDGVTATPGIITPAGELVIPPTDAGLAGCTAARVLELLPQVRREGVAPREQRTRPPRSEDTNHTPSFTRATGPERQLIASTSLYRPLEGGGWGGGRGPRARPTTPSFPPCPSLSFLQWLDECPDLRDAIRTVSRRRLPVGEARTAAHAFLLGSATRVAPVTRWDDAEIGGGAPTTAVLRLRELLDRDRDPVEGDGTQHVQVPYGVLTGMVVE